MNQVNNFGFSHMQYCKKAALSDGVIAALKLKPKCYFPTFDHFDYQRSIIMNVYGCITQEGFQTDAS